ncbi:Cysteine-rich repeat secretory protein 55 [Apostasia shenzhenica]|uniref:Cysteine-rich repeat secretory protein 55 n=1 Tax=Apostasia shenzhenica TaxID=1088818 RepID=A0A2H9ZWJ7_9ASPA|nr:Cysteine-rich repeat secretory protein 55 [Apostasia shenzhenica]
MENASQRLLLIGAMALLLRSPVAVGIECDPQASSNPAVRGRLESVLANLVAMIDRQRSGLTFPGYAEIVVYDLEGRPPLDIYGNVWCVAGAPPKDCLACANLLAKSAKRRPCIVRADSVTLSYGPCVLRYSAHNFFGEVPNPDYFNVHNTGDTIPLYYEGHFNKGVSGFFIRLAHLVLYSWDNYGELNEEIFFGRTRMSIEATAQCSPDMTSPKILCVQCLMEARKKFDEGLCNGSMSCTILYSNCILKYATTTFKPEL